jgi:predicted transport protein
MTDVGFGSSPLRLNEGLGTLTNWDEASIKARAEKLATRAAKVWSAPNLDPAILQAYRPSSPQVGYTLADHPQLASGPMRVLFDAFREEVLALDPCVTQEVLKVYIAFKAETNFVDVIPQAKRLRLTLNTKFHEIDDPRGVCKDISGIGRWGNGEVDVGLSSLDELPYIMGLVRQSLECQMAGAGGV